MPQKKQKKLKSLIGKVDLLVAAAEPGVVLTDEMCMVGVEFLMQIKWELMQSYDHNPKCFK